MIHEQTRKYEWNAVEFEHQEKSVDWYWGLGIVIVTGMILTIIAGNYLLAFLLFMGGVLLGIYANDKPRSVHVELSERGIKMNSDLYTYDTIASFWMYVDHKNRNRLIVVTGRPVMPQRIIMLPETISAKDLRDYLSQFIEEKETKPSAIETLAESFGL